MIVDEGKKEEGERGVDKGSNIHREREREGERHRKKETQRERHR